MRRIILAAVLLVSVAPSAWADRKVALVMADDDYKAIRPLKNAVNDGRAIQDALEKLGFEVFSETNRDLRRMRRALEDFREDGKDADVALVYFSGHGVELAGDNRLLPVDADASSLEKLKDTTLPLEEVREAVVETGKIGLIILDACRNDPFGSVATDGSRGAAALTPQVKQEAKPGLGRMGKAENVLFAFSASPGETALDGTGANSPFTTALSKYVGTDGLEFRSVLTLVQQEVYDVTRGKQLPYVESGLPKLFFATADSGALPERERLLLAMADVTPDLRNEVERLASEKDIPLAPLYAALISSDAKDLSQADRQKKLTEAADSFVSTRAQMKALSSSDPAVGRLRDEAETQLALGAFDTARGKLAEAATIDSTSRDALKANFLQRTLSEAATHTISGGASRTELKYDLAIESYSKAVALFDDVDRETLPPEARRQQIDTLDTLGDLYVTVGNLAEGRKAYEREVSVATGLADADPGDAGWRTSLASSVGKLGDVQRDQGDSTAALAAYERSLALRRKSAKASPDNAQASGLEAATLLQIGALHKLQGNSDKALDAYQAARAIAEKLAAADPANEDTQATLAKSLRRIGEIQQAGKQLPEAVASFQAGLDIAAKLAGAKPDDAQRQSELADAYDAMGSIQYDQAREAASLKYVENGGEEAIASYDRAIGIDRKLIEADPRNTAWQRGLATTLAHKGEAIYFGDNNITSEDSDRSLAAYKESIALREKLVSSDRTNKVWLFDLVGAYEQMATWHEFRVEDDKAIDFTKKAHQASLDLAALDPLNIEWQRKATMYHAKISESYIQLKDYKSALDYETKGLEYAVKVAKANPTKPVYFNDVTTFGERLARLYFVQKDMKNYWAQNDFTLEQAKRNEQRFPEDIDTLRHLIRASIAVADTWTKNDPDKAFGLYEDARGYAQRAASLDPKNPEFPYEVYNTQIKTGYMFEDRGETAKALEAYQNARDTITGVVAMKPDDAGYTASLEHANARIAGLRGQASQPAQ